LDRLAGDRYLAQNVESVNISGGEPYAHPRLTDFTVRLVEGYPRLREVCINTDGHLLDELDSFLDATLARCRERDQKMRLYISLDGLGAAHDRHRRHTGAFRLADRALRHLADRRSAWPDTLRVTASFTVTSGNADEIVPVFDYVRDLDIRVDYNLAARPEVFIGGAGLDRDFQVEHAQVQKVREALRVVCASPGFSNFSEAFYATMLETLESGRRQRGCFFPEKGFVVMPDGRLHICGTYLDFYFGDLMASDFETLWRGTARAACRAEKIPGKCEQCFSNSYEDWDLVKGAVV
jgi:MoaA/NifB/PqqE/SkfB family radical SAM enzyme